MDALHRLPFGHGTVSLRWPSGVPDAEYITYDGSLKPAVADPIAIVRDALEHPMGSEPLSVLAQGRKQAVILISDRSRLSPSHLFLPLLLDQLNAGGVPDERIRIIVALGMHRQQTAQELRALAGPEACRRVAVENHSPQPVDCLHMGTTSRGTPIEINRTVVEADLRIVTGNIEPHPLVGVSGGYKAVLPGTASHRTIEANHALSAQHPSRPGDLDHPLRMDLEEIGQVVPVDFLLNVVVDPRHCLLDAVAGDVVEAHRAGAEKANRRFLVPCGKEYDLVVASAGGHPKDAQLYQAVKAMQNASKLTAPGGMLVMAARCEEGFGHGLFQYWTETVPDRTEIRNRLKDQFVLGPHKLAQIHSLLDKHPILLYSDMPDALVELTGIQPIRDLEQVIRQQAQQRSLRSAAVMPYASVTFPQRTGP